MSDTRDADHTQPDITERYIDPRDIKPGNGFRKSSRWAVEECFPQAKNEPGLDQYQVRDWRAWYAHITLSIAAHAWLAVARSLTQKGEPPSPRT